MNFIDYKYIMLLGSRLDRFKEAGSKMYNFRCPICGDSKKNKLKSRAYLLYDSGKNSVRFFCHNCGASYGFSQFLKLQAPDLFQQYKVDMFGDSCKVKTNDSKIEALIKESTPTYAGDNPLSRCHQLSSCPDSLSFVLDYARSRCLPESLYDEIYAVKSIRDVTSRIPKYDGKEMPDLPALVIPFFRTDGSYSYLQCRVAVKTDSDFRFATLQLDETGPKLYGENHIAWNKPVYVLEGPIDSMFVDNSLANAGASHSTSYVTDRLKRAGMQASDCVLLFDNEYSVNKDVKRHVDQAVSAGLSVVIFDKEFDGIKDINEAVKDYGWTRKEVNEYVRRRTYNGLKAKLALSNLGRR